MNFQNIVSKMSVDSIPVKIVIVFVFHNGIVG